MVLNGPTWSQMVQHGRRWYHMVQNGPRQSQILSYVFTWPLLVSKGTNCFNWFQMNRINNIVHSAFFLLRRLPSYWVKPNVQILIYFAFLKPIRTFDDVVLAGSLSGPANQITLEEGCDKQALPAYVEVIFHTSLFFLHCIKDQRPN